MRPERPSLGKDRVNRAVAKMESEGPGRLVIEVGEANKRKIKSRVGAKGLNLKRYFLELVRNDGVDVDVGED